MARPMTSGDAQGVQGRGAIQPDLGPVGQVLEVEAADGSKRRGAHPQSGDRRRQRQDHVLDHELPCDLDGGGAEGQPGRQLLEPRPGAYQDEVGHVDAADQEHEEGAAPQQVQRRLHRSHEVVGIPIDYRAEPRVEQDLLVLREALKIGRVQGVDLGLRLLESCAWLEPTDVPVVVAVALGVGFLLGRERKRSPERDVGCHGLEGPGHHADDPVGLAVEAQVLAHRSGIAAELAVPEGIAQHDLLLVPDLAFLLGERPSERRGDPEQGEERRRDVHDPDAGGHAVLAEAHAAVVEHGLVLEDSRLAEAVVVVGHPRVRDVPGPSLGIAVAHQQDPVRLRDGEGPEQHVTHHGKEGRVGADAERQGQRGGQCERLVPKQKPQPGA